MKFQAALIAFAAGLAVATPTAASIARRSDVAGSYDAVDGQHRDWDGQDYGQDYDSNKNYGTKRN